MAIELLNMGMNYEKFGPVFRFGNIVLINCDCMDLLRDARGNFWDLCITDPPYGMGERLFKGGRENKKGRISAAMYRGKKWDIPPDRYYFDQLFRVSKNQIIWGGNYFSLPPSRCFIVWDKRQPLETYSFGELAWTSFDKPAYKVDYPYTNYVEGSGRPDKKIHPTQKPIGLYERVLSKYAKPGQRILDTHLGSASSAIAAHYFGCDFVGCEIDRDYYDSAVERFNRETRQIDIF